MMLQLNFDEPSCVSADSNKGDLITIDFVDQELFKDFDQNVEIEEKLVVQERIGRQLYSV